jgi:hypothetical protein
MPNIDGALNGLLRLLIPAAAIAGAVLAVIMVLDRMAIDSQAAERRALIQRNAQLDMRATAPGSALACLDAGAGETVQNACEKVVFADAQSVAGAVAYAGARLSLLKDAFDFAQRGNPDLLRAFAGTRRAIELDRYGFAAHVLANRDGCTVDRCPAFAMLNDTGTLKANLKAQVFDAYVDRYAAAWSKTAPAAEQLTAAAPAAPPTAPAASVAAPPAMVGRPVDSRWDFPSSASIPPVSIMNSEPKLPPQPVDESQTAAQPEGAPPLTVPLPPSRPQAQAVVPPPMAPAR